MLELKFEECREEYWDFMRCLRSDPRVQAGFVDQVSITADEQRTFMMRNGQHYQIALIGTRPVGYFGFIGPSRSEVTICVLPEESGKGIGRMLIKKSLTYGDRVWAKVKNDNIPSLRIMKGQFSFHQQRSEMIIFAQSPDAMRHALNEFEA